MQSKIRISAMVMMVALVSFGLKAQTVQKKINALIQANVESPGPFSGSVLVAHKGEVVFRGAYGPANLETGKINKVDSRYFIGSLTKQQTTVAILQLVSQGKISLADKMSKWFPTINRANEITIHHLLSHQSGLARDSKQGYDERVSPKDRVLSVKNDTLMFDPGTKESYSSVGFYALTHIVEEVSGFPYEKYFQKFIFDPAGMKDSGVRMRAGEHVEALSTGMHMKVDNHGVNDLGHARYFDSYSLAGGGSLYSTIDDVYAFFKALKEGKLLAQKELDLMKVKWPTERRGPRFYHTYGWEVWDYSNEKREYKIYDFTGRIYGYKALIRYIEYDDILVITLCNNDFSERNILAGNIRRILLGQEYELPEIPASIELAEKAIHKHEGVYDFPEEKTTVEIKMINGKLTLTSHGDAPLYLYSMNDTTFYSNLIPLRITFEPTSKAKTNKLTWNFNGEMIHTISRKDD